MSCLLEWLDLEMEKNKNMTLWEQELSFSTITAPHNLLKYHLLVYGTGLQFNQIGFPLADHSAPPGPNSVPVLVLSLSCPQPSLFFFNAYPNYIRSLSSKGNAASWTSLTRVFQHELSSLNTSVIVSVSQSSRSVVSDSLWPHELQHTRLPCPSPTPGACSNSCPLSQRCHPTISSSVVPISSCLQSFPASGSFQMSWLSLQVAKVLELQLQHQSFQMFRTHFL